MGRLVHELTVAQSAEKLYRGVSKNEAVRLYFLRPASVASQKRSGGGEVRKSVLSKLDEPKSEEHPNDHDHS